MIYCSKLIFLYFLCLLTIGCATMNSPNSKILSVSGNYIHDKTGMIFPEHFDVFQREKINSFDDDNANIGVSYYSTDVKVTVYVYPASVALESRLLNEYYRCLKSIAYQKGYGIDATSKIIPITKEGYKVNGIRASIKDENFNSVLLLFECGKFFVKYRISSVKSDTSCLNKISERLANYFSPIDVLKKVSLKLGTTIHIAPVLVNDTASLDPIVAAALSKAKWVFENVDSTERIAGFPSLYFNEQKVAVTNMLEKWEKQPSENATLKIFFKALISLRNDGVLNEFICDQYNNLLILPDNVKLNIEKYSSWKKIKHPTINLNGALQYYFLGYAASYNQAK